MKSREAPVVRELSAEELEGVRGGTGALLSVAGGPLVGLLRWFMPGEVGDLCEQDPEGKGTTIGNCDTI